MTTNVNFSVAKLLDPANRSIAENFNVDVNNVFDNRTGLFSFENTYNSIQLAAMFASEVKEDEPGGIWDAVCRIDLERNLFVVVGNEGCSGFGATVEAFFNAKGLIVDYKISGEVRTEGLEAKVRTLYVDEFMVEPRTEETEAAIRKAYAPVLDEDKE
jgi:hypothetical protein